MSSDLVVVNGALLTARERRVARSPWPSLNRAMSLQWFVIAITPFLPLAYLVAALDLPLSAIFISFVLSVGGLCIALMLANNVMVTMMRELMRVPTATEPDDWRIDSESLQFNSSRYKTMLSWSALVDVQEAPDVFHFILSPAQVFALSKRYLSEGDARTLRDLIAGARERGDVKGVPGL